MSNEALNELVQSVVKDRRSQRLWKNIRCGAWILLSLTFFFSFVGLFKEKRSSNAEEKPYVSLVRMSGVILPETNFSAESVIPELQNAFLDKKAKGVVLVINSPGGSPVQASIIHDKILELKKRYHKTVIVLGEDALASGSYLVATAADKIYVNPDTLTGSIGVIMNGFGVVDTMKKLGVTRRVFTAGNHKDRLDPFLPLQPDDEVKIHHVLDDVHQRFIQYVVSGRGARLQGDPKELFSGDFWTGAQAVKLGLADGTSELWDILQQEFKVRHYRDYTTHPSFLETALKGLSTELSINLIQPKSPLRAQAY
ncbi:MAG: peptidase U7 [Gammaproteobacteria bacterium RIFCSPHIGHO2_12_FULL_45_9]|nr:MAG: peptidase U7 [Gammaproteobacteria bacterium RIFCSPHIGHO2_12_FULL_45_9]